jgi:hypothetical protein
MIYKPPEPDGLVCLRPFAVFLFAEKGGGCIFILYQLLRSMSEKARSAKLYIAGLQIKYIVFTTQSKH